MKNFRKAKNKFMINQVKSSSLNNSKIKNSVFSKQEGLLTMRYKKNNDESYLVNFLESNEV